MLDSEGAVTTPQPADIVEIDIRKTVLKISRNGTPLRLSAQKDEDGVCILLSVLPLHRDACCAICRIIADISGLSFKVTDWKIGEKFIAKLVP